MSGRLHLIHRLLMLIQPLLLMTPVGTLSASNASKTSVASEYKSQFHRNSRSSTDNRAYSEENHLHNAKLLIKFPLKCI